MGPGNPKTFSRRVPQKTGCCLQVLDIIVCGEYGAGRLRQSRKKGGAQPRFRPSIRPLTVVRKSWMSKGLVIT
jgi:hypothetical protein